jgi:chaperonin GroES
MNLQPLEDRIVVRPAEAEETTISGLVIPDTAKEKPQQGEVLAVGPGRRAENSGELIAMELAPGDTVVYSKYGGTEITVDGEDCEEEVAQRKLVSAGGPNGPPVSRLSSAPGPRRGPWPTCSRPCRSGPA